MLVLPGLDGEHICALQNILPGVGLEVPSAVFALSQCSLILIRV